MPSQRRFRVLTYLVIAGVVTLLFFTSQARHSRDTDRRSIQDFYSKTANEIDKQHGAGTGGDKAVVASHDVDADGDIDDDDAVLAKQMAERLRQAEEKAKDSAKAKGPNKPDAPKDVIGVGSSAGGQKPPVPEEKAEPEVQESKEDHEVKEVSYCPYSARAKGILTEKYVIEPAPYVVELDQHPLGPKIQERLGELTGRKTVPNVMIYGTSIGGGDDVAALDREKGLIAKIESLGNGHLQIQERFSNAKAA
ncbi:hypothetical protein N0V88_004362 [Collariella sp. IMI 366227]|nr:hypothetical protein N0V88_004362 [Collariella sp. IMI 366227]